MYLTVEQSKYINEHLTNPEKAFATGATAKKLAMTRSELGVSPDDIGITALVMNIAETSENMKINGVSIYSQEYGPWDEGAKKLNELKGLESISMANLQGIILSDEAKQAIITCSRGGSLNNMAITLKVAQTLEAIKYPRWSRGEKKDPAKDIEEVTTIINEELDFMLRGQKIDNVTKENLRKTIIAGARTVYHDGKKQEIRSKLGVISWDDAKSAQEWGIQFDDSNPARSMRVDRLLQIVPEDRIDELHSQIEEITLQKGAISSGDIDLLVDGVLKKWEKEYNVKTTPHISID